MESILEYYYKGQLPLKVFHGFSDILGYLPGFCANELFMRDLYLFPLWC